MRAEAPAGIDRRRSVHLLALRRGQDAHQLAVLTLALMRDLRARCEWDAAQTHDSLRPYLIWKRQSWMKPSG